MCDYLTSNEAHGRDGRLIQNQSLTLCRLQWGVDLGYVPLSQGVSPLCHQRQPPEVGILDQKVGGKFAV